LLLVIWSIVVFAVSASKAKSPPGTCQYGPMSVCNFGIAWGVIGWLLTILIIVLVVLHVVKDASFTPLKECIANAVMVSCFIQGNLLTNIFFSGGLVVYCSCCVSIASFDVNFC